MTELDWSSTMNDLTVADVNAVTCPECGETVTGYESRRGMREKVDVYEAWPGGPTLAVPTKQVIMEPDGPSITTLEPCGHRVGRIVYTEAACEQMKAGPYRMNGKRGNEWGGGKDQAEDHQQTRTRP